MKLYLWRASRLLASYGLPRPARIIRLVFFTFLLGMGYYIFQHSPTPVSAPSDPADRLRHQLETGSPLERREALTSLVAARAEHVLTDCLASNDPTVVQLAISGLWECWLGEEGADARLAIDRGTEAMNNGDLDAATAVFTGLMDQYPQWAEAINKQATVLYLQARPEESIALCRRVVALKSDHFGAWNGMAICAIQVEDWPLALQAVRESLRMQPHSSMNLQLLRLVQSRVPSV